MIGNDAGWKHQRQQARLSLLRWMALGAFGGFLFCGFSGFLVLLWACLGCFAGILFLSERLVPGHVPLRQAYIETHRFLGGQGCVFVGVTALCSAVFWFITRMTRSHIIDAICGKPLSADYNASAWMLWREALEGMLWLPIGPALLMGFYAMRLPPLPLKANQT